MAITYLKPALLVHMQLLLCSRPRIQCRGDRAVRGVELGLHLGLALEAGGDLLAQPVHGVSGPERGVFVDVDKDSLAFARGIGDPGEARWRRHAARPPR